MDENDANHCSEVEQGHMPVKRDEESLGSSSPSHSMLNETRRMGPFIVESRDEPQGEKSCNDGGHRCLEKRRAGMLIDQEKMRLPSEVLRHSVLNERVDIETSNGKST